MQPAANQTLTCETSQFADSTGTTTELGPATAVYEHASHYCPVCSQRLESHRCKMICAVCGYYMSCADYY